ATDDEVLRPDDLRLVLDVELVEVDLAGGVDLVLRQVLRRDELEDVYAARDLGAVDVAVVPIGRPEAAEAALGGVERTAVKVGDLEGMRGVGEVDDRDAALVPRLDEDVAAGDRDQRAV